MKILNVEPGGIDCSNQEPAEWQPFDCPKCGLATVAKDKHGCWCQNAECDWNDTACVEATKG